MKREDEARYYWRLATDLAAMRLDTGRRYRARIKHTVEELAAIHTNSEWPRLREAVRKTVRLAARSATS